MGGRGCFVPTDWAEIGIGSFAYFAISTEVKVRADSSRQIRLQTGVVLRWNGIARSSVESCDSRVTHSTTPFSV